jgi:hypothetical protein
MRECSDRLPIDTHEPQFGCCFDSVFGDPYGTHEKEVTESAISFSATGVGFPTGSAPLVDPFNQLGAASQNAMGGHGVSA